jgi:hypothetical protein
MAEDVIDVRASREEVRRALGRLGSFTDLPAEAARALLVRLGMAALSLIKQAFVVKARGGTDEAGDRWPPLSPRTIAYSRRHPGLPPPKTRAQRRPSYALTARQRDRWWALYGRALAAFDGDKGHAAAFAWTVLKKEGATTLLDRYGQTRVEILRDKGLLLNSLSPGVYAAGSTSAPRVENQVFRTGPAEVIVGTNRKGAAAHHEGVPGRLPQRRLWPSPKRWPASWWQELLETLRQGMIEVALSELRR